MSKRKPYCSVNLQALDSLKSKTGSNWVSERHCIVVQLCFVMKTQSFYITSSFNAAYPLPRPLNTILLPFTSTLPTNHIIGLFSTSKNLKNVKFYFHISKKTSEKINRMVNSENFNNKNRLTLREREGLGRFPMFGYCGTWSAP